MILRVEDATNDDVLIVDFLDGFLHVRGDIDPNLVAEDAVIIVFFV
jgi:hypothetical protein